MTYELICDTCGEEILSTTCYILKNGLCFHNGECEANYEPKGDEPMNQNEIRKIGERAKPQVQLSGTDGNAFAIMGRVRDEMRKCGWSRAEIASATDSMMSGDYDNLIVVACTLCEVD